MIEYEKFQKALKHLELQYENYKNLDAAQPELMKEAVLNVTNPLLGKGIVAVDLDDIKAVMQCGKTTHFSIAEAAGSQRAKQAAHDALRHLPNSKHALSIICTIETGSDFQLDEFNEISAIVENALSDNCLTLTCTTFNPLADALKISITACSE